MHPFINQSANQLAQSACPPTTQDKTSKRKSPLRSIALVNGSRATNKPASQPASQPQQQGASKSGVQVSPPSGPTNPSNYPRKNLRSKSERTESGGGGMPSSRPSFAVWSGWWWSTLAARSRMAEDRVKRARQRRGKEVRYEEEEVKWRSDGREGCAWWLKLKLPPPLVHGEPRRDETFHSARWRASERARGAAQQLPSGNLRVPHM
ncbi:hypothetical protein IWX50DRAFT_77362 [Phyllosticta citricarpa]